MQKKEHNRKKINILDPLVLSSLGLFLIIFLGIFSPLIAPHDPNFTNLPLRNLPPIWMEGGRWDFVLGTDNIGRDLLSRCLYGIRTSFGIATFGLIFSAILGIGLGLCSGLGPLWVDRLIMTITDVFITLPNILLLLCGITLFGTEIWVLIVLIGLVRWEAYARLVRGQVLSLRTMGYVESCKALGGSPFRIALLHILPNLASPLVVILTLSFPGVLLMEAGLSFLGVGVQPPTSSLGRMIGDGRDYLINAWWICGIPSIVIISITLLFQVIGDTLRDRVDVFSDD